MLDYFFFGRLCIKLYILSSRYFNLAHKNPNFIIFSGFYLSLAKLIYYLYLIEFFVITLLSSFLSICGLSLIITFIWSLNNIIKF